MLIGSYIQKVGPRYRVALPSRFRQILGKKIILTRGYEGCLLVIPHRSWQELFATVAKGPFVSRAVRDTTRFLLGSAFEIELDDQGRFVLPETLRIYAQIGGEVVFLGLGRWVEIWDSKRWELRQKYLEKRGSGLAERLAKVEL
ncbi:cell division/cell wall cluster transcriptional repressor MraZ [candidate division WWE3 bacterium CG09_land_8_20_14_0_10_47_33]|uniref:Transcriptional regulator MraZ n=1 Tax=candidate division WWE3 bacterium CG_4_9_14_0_2_um_filter_48_10 TaxID=1975078 RepID=A0A2M8EKF8_UNCKA|nr:MAG: cell division/cell wall cluster transcriptional repressor MraZ [candidate division WWE3 bacterium CG09_land_8_20_14_0_10_47_33]PIZ41224.1 MAG: cell division/cell wall cluster transcriptional repressor MraZ [candidate division WWE3 bacterium CG_4_10_14_0_2_um_filter_47_8]PJC23221.1 MAG: cell division/cell wall cluster transcriptional repressor MraZ [candidate division WWE3 bacterium CG_4_9_14_0_2_um_filter_48_10]PJE51389.1 MAG: cell division/cell wall cluster transcriptional repressor Mra